MGTALSSKTWQRDLYAIWLAQLVAVAGTNAIMPILSLYVPVLGAQSEQEVRIWAGIVFSAHSVSLAIFSPVWGAFSDRYGRKVTMMAAMLGGALSIALMGAAQNVRQLALLRALQGALGGMIIPAASTLVATTAPHERVGYALGLLRAVLYAGASVGPLLGGLVADGLGYRAAFWIAGVLLALAALVAWLSVKEAFQPAAPPMGAQAAGDKDRDSARSGHRPWERLAPLLSSLPLLAVLGVRVLMRLGFHSTRPVVPLLIQAIAPAGARVASASGLIGGISMAVGAVGSVVLGRLGDRVGYRRILAACAMVSAACYLAHAFAGDLAALLFLQAGTALAMSGILASIFASLARVAPEGQEGVVYGVDQSVDAVVSSVGPIAGSALAASVGLRAPFLFAAGAFGLAGVVAARLLPKRGVAHN